MPLKKRWILAIIICIHAVSILAVYPFARNKKIDTDGKCSNKWEEKHIFIIYCCWGCLAMLVPLAIILCSQIQMFMALKAKNLQSEEEPEERLIEALQKISRKFLLVLIGFFICCIPYTIFVIFYTYSVAYNHNYIVKHSFTLDICGKVTFALMTGNSCISPILYGRTGSAIIRLVVSFRASMCGKTDRKTKHTELNAMEDDDSE